MKQSELVKGRVQVINLWRPLRGPLRDATACHVRRHDRGAGRSRRLDPDLSQPQWRDLIGQIQSCSTAGTTSGT